MAFYEKCKQLIKSISIHNNDILIVDDTMIVRSLITGSMFYEFTISKEENNNVNISFNATHVATSTDIENVRMIYKLYELQVSTLSKIMKEINKYYKNSASFEETIGLEYFRIYCDIKCRDDNRTIIITDSHLSFLLYNNSHKVETNVIYSVNLPITQFTDFLEITKSI